MSNSRKTSKKRVLLKKRGLSKKRATSTSKKDIIYLMSPDGKWKDINSIKGGF
jgi:hypothetical protein